MKLLLCALGLVLAVTSAAAYTVELYVYVDGNVKNGIKGPANEKNDYKNEIEYMVSEVNNIFKHQRTVHNIDLNLVVSKFDYAPNGASLFPSGTGSGAAAKKFQDYLAKQTVKYDIGLLYTASTFGPKGYATGTPCASSGFQGVAMVTFADEVTDIFITAHEIGHVLGLGHDFNQGIMAPTIYPTNKNKFQFSSAKAADLKKNLVTFSTCLSTTSGPGMAANKRPTNNYLDPDYMCRKNARSFLASAPNWYPQKKFEGDNICFQVWCGTDNQNTVKGIHATDGWKCANEKRCKFGKCVAADWPTGPVDNKCVYGDQKKRNFDMRVTCASHYANANNKCAYDGGECCKTCPK